MMYLLRHGCAGEGNGDDAARRSTPKGERQARAAGRALGSTLTALLRARDLDALAGEA